MGEILVQKIVYVKCVVYSGNHAILSLKNNILNLKEIAVQRKKFKNDVERIRITIEVLS
ncbi:MAG: hypothetical protein ISS82_03755 [Nanoarchaeota archaeon]|nr:hypothetical protein [Nanoarchaeota archaeon]